MLPLPALVAKWQTRTLEVRVEKSMGVRVSPSAPLNTLGTHRVFDEIFSDALTRDRNRLSLMQSHISIHTLFRDNFFESTFAPRIITCTFL